MTETQPAHDAPRETRVSPFHTGETAPEPIELPGEPELTDLLALVYRAVDWKTQGGKSVLDRWSGMCLVASRAETIGALVNTLCTRLGVGALPPESTTLLTACKPHERALLGLMADETVPMAMKAYAKARASR